MKSLLVYATLAIGVVGVPQRGGTCSCRDVICPNNGRDACECLNRAADDCFRTWRDYSCPSASPLNCNGPLPRPPLQTGPFGWQPGGNGVSTWFNGGGRPTSSGSTYYSVVPYRTTMTTTLPGFGWPNPVTSLSYGMSTTTITLTHGKLPSSLGPDFPKISTITQSRSPTSQPRATSSSSRSWIPPWQIGGGQSQSPSPSSSSAPAPKSSSPSPTPTRQTSLAPRPPTSRPAPWTPPVQDGQLSWTPVVLPTLSPEAPVPTQAPPEPIPTPVAAPEPVVVPQVEVPSGPPAKCGPGMPKCVGATYCDPQPLCSIGEDCPGVCLPINSIRVVTRNGWVNSSSVQPWEKRREFWQKMLDEGYYVMYRHIGY